MRQFPKRQRKNWVNVGNEEHIGVFACATALNVPGKSEKFEAARRQ